MKLNPPETAPKDGTVFLACFFNEGPIYQTLFDLENDDELVWVASNPIYHQRYGVLFGFCEEDITGWLPMPQIDGEGNVTWPSVSPE